MLEKPWILVRGAGDLATGVLVRLARCGFRVCALECANPSAIRRKAAFCEAVWQGRAEVEGLVCQRIDRPEQAEEAARQGIIPLLIDETCARTAVLHPAAVVDAILAKKNLGTTLADAPLVIGVGPGFCAGQDCHYVVETKRGHRLGRGIEEGPAAPNSGLPGNIMGYTGERIIRSTVSGRFEPLCAIGDLVEAGQTVARVNGEELKVQIPGMIRGMLHEGIEVTPGFKCGDVDPRGREADYTTISDKARAVAGGVLETVLRRYGSRMQ